MNCVTCGVDVGDRKYLCHTHQVAEWRRIKKIGMVPRLRYARGVTIVCAVCCRVMPSFASSRCRGCYDRTYFGRGTLPGDYFPRSLGLTFDEALR
ncbi:MAG: hypothetical protein ACYCOU_20405 [Sulfobacillus sp.]